MESLVSVSVNQITIRIIITSTFAQTPWQLKVGPILLFGVFDFFIGHVMYPDHLIYGEFEDETVAKLVPSFGGTLGKRAWRMHDDSFQTYWEDSSNDNNGNSKLKYTFQFPIIFEKLVIVKQLDQQKQR